LLDFKSLFLEGERMSETNWEVVYETTGSFLAEILRGLLEAQEIQVVLSQEGLAHVYGLTVGTLGRVQILVPSHDLERAQQILEEYENSANTDLEATDTEMPADESVEDANLPDQDQTD
jgi:hypothetical protein